MAYVGEHLLRRPVLLVLARRGDVHPVRILRVHRLRRRADEVAVGARLVRPIRRRGRGVGDVVERRGRPQTRDTVDRRVAHRVCDVDESEERDVLGLAVAVGVEGECQPAAAVVRRARHTRLYRLVLVRGDVYLGDEPREEGLRRDLGDLRAGVDDDGRPFVVERMSLRKILVNTLRAASDGTLFSPAALHA